jgi:hypothetical protein
MPSRLLLLLVFCSPLAFAQAPLEREPAGEPRLNQKIERLVVEDDANRIEELRVGGRSQGATVQPKGGLPAYELPATDVARGRLDTGRDLGRQRVWNVFGF